MNGVGRGSVRPGPRRAGVATFAVVLAVMLGVAAIAALNLARAQADVPFGSGARIAQPAAPEAVTPPEAQGVSNAVQRVGVDPAWVDATARATGIPTRALAAYATASLVISGEEPECGIGWNTIAGIGAIESDHGRHGGATLGEDGYSVPAIRGPALDGNGVAAIADSDGGRWDGDATWDRAVGPMQFIPDTWARWGADANGDGIADPNQIDDAALATARYLCAGGPMTSVDGWRAAVFSYNHLDSYVDDVAVVANRYATAVG
ncbi:lytic transglycosylase domain-containing protein [Microbacterium rhizomatis]|uniref:Murein transglycosylase n=1 Tax=Microbacterium rhizomatis TaxID=1631477 RepID=A0A5J5J860_9MICO|nr:lytic murein transglycosylase [Microbacterium rhizomatis]KAA9111344.1 murein transglycosylase [Microbacterium rhizomatis]